MKFSKNNANAEKYDHRAIEAKWQKKWHSKKIFASKEDPDKMKYYVLDMFPYPSGEGLHVGHPKGYIATDIVSRFHRMNNYSVLHPMGFDAFGLPAENYAIKMKINPADAVKKNVARFKKQLEIIGLDYDWKREINTTDPNYYRWTQWIFLQLFKKGLAYESLEPINWCPSCKTGLANEDVEDGKCLRCGTVIEKKLMKQWMLRITDYADRLLNDLDAVDTSESPHIIDKKWPPREGKKTIERRTIHAIVRDPKTGKYLSLKWKNFPWITFIVGGVEDGEDIIKAAQREVEEETGYKNLKFIRVLGGPVVAEYYAAHKDQNRLAITSGILFELGSEIKVPIEKNESDAHDAEWMDPKDMNAEVMTCAELPVWLERLQKNNTNNDKQSKIHSEERDETRPLLDWPNAIKDLQRNWIGRSEGAEIDFELLISNKKPQSEPTKQKIKIFTTRPDTLFGVTYIVIAPEHKLIDELLNYCSNTNEVKSYITKSSQETEIDRTNANKEKSGVELKGIRAINPVNNDSLPVWISDYVLVNYGTGAVMAVPAHDDRDWMFAKKFNMPIKQVIRPFIVENNNSDEAFTDEGIMINSDKFNGRNSDKILKEITALCGGKWTKTYKLKDWVFSRQRYWGEPIPIIHCEKCGIVPVPEKDLPVKLPIVKYYEPTGTGESPLSSISKWVNVKCPNCNSRAKRETNTMPQWAGSSWYYLRYEDPINSKAVVSSQKEKYWSPVDLYVGGAEHATRHLIYARFWHKFLYDIGVVSTNEPFKRLQHVGLIMAADGRKMSKSLGNVINPDEIVKTYGADTLRVYEMFLGPFDQQITWNTDGIIGARRFIEKIWRLKDKISLIDSVVLTKSIHKTIRKVTEDINNLRFNTAISAMMILVNEMDSSKSITMDQFEILLKLSCPFAPHITDELWEKIGHKNSIHISDWPKYDESFTLDSIVKIVVQVSGKVRGSFDIKTDSSVKEIETTAKAIPEINKWLEGRTIKKIIHIPNRIINFVT